MREVNEQSANYQLADLTTARQTSHAGNTLLKSLPVWLSAQTRKSAGRGRSANNTLQYGVQKLRELILELAVRGKLVPQNPNDEPASMMLEKIAEEKVQLLEEGKIKKQNSLSEIKEAEKLFNLPQGWCWVRLGYISEFTNGYAFKSSDFSNHGVGIVKIGDITNGQISLASMSRVDRSIVIKLDNNLQVNPGEMLIAMSGATTGKLGFNTTNEVFYINQRVGKIAPYILSCEFLYYPLTTKIQENLSISMGSAIPNLSTSQIKNIVIALPPLAEQHRIVKKVDELMALCDQLEQKQADAVQAHDTLVKVLLDTLTQSENAEDFQQSWHRIAENFETLFTTESSIDQLKQTLLQLAVMGRLVPQASSDQLTKEFLRDIKIKKSELIKDKVIKNSSSSDSIITENCDWLTPSQWGIVELQDFFRFIDYRGKNPKKSSNGIRLITAKNIRMGYLKEQPIEYISSDLYEKWMVRGLPKQGDILFVTEGHTMGFVTLINLDFPFALAQRTICLQPYKEVCSRFFLYLMMSKQFQSIVNDNQTGSAAGGIKASKLKKIPIPIPPPQEQHRIVKKVDDLMALCDQLKDRLNQAQTLQQELADAVVEQTIK